MIHVFIVNPIACEMGYAQKLRNTLEQIPNLHYYVFSTRRRGHEKEIVQLICRFFDNEELRFYCCGGSGTMRNMLDGISDISKVELSMIPFGTCDFLKVFTDDMSFFRDVKSLIYGEVVYVDYMSTNLGKALNSVSFGADTDSLRVGEDLRSLGIGRHYINYWIASFYAAFLSPKKSFDLRFENNTMSNTRVTLMYFGNGSVIGGRFHVGLNDIVDDGIGSYCYVKGKAPYARLMALNSAARGDEKKLSKYAQLSTGRFLKARRSNGAAFNVEMDGELFSTVDLDVEIVRQGLKFIIPNRGL